jgi:hypothetical protein
LPALGDGAEEVREADFRMALKNFESRLGKHRFSIPGHRGITGRTMRDGQEASWWIS